MNNQIATRAVETCTNTNDDATAVAEAAAPPVAVIEDNTPIGIDVVGLDSDTNGRACTAHVVCGHFVKVDDILITKWAIMNIEGYDQIVAQVHKIDADGFVRCVNANTERNNPAKMPAIKKAVAVCPDGNALVLMASPMRIN